MKTVLPIIKGIASLLGVLLLAAVFVGGSYWIRAPHEQATINGSAFAPVDPTPVPTDDVSIPAVGESILPQNGTQPMAAPVAAPVVAAPSAPAPAAPAEEPPPADVPPPAPTYPVAHGAPCIPPGVIINGNCQAPQTTPPPPPAEPTADPSPGS